MQPSHIASWTSHSQNAEAGPSRHRHIALASRDNTIWIRSTLVPSSSPSEKRAAEKDQLPKITTTPDPSSSYQSKSTRASLSRRESDSNRPRATSSSASSILTTSSNQRRRISAFSPPTSARQIPTATLTSATVIVSPTEVHSHRDSTSPLADLREHLREQKGPDNPDDRPSLGLGIAGLGRKGLPGVHGQVGLEHSGVASPKSAISETKSVGSRLRGWIGTGEDDEVGKEKEKAELKERIGEIEVEREMEREIMEEDREKVEMRVIEDARRTPTPRTATLEEVPKRDEDGLRVRRVVLPRPGFGEVMDMKVVKRVGLCVLRDIG